MHRVELAVVPVRERTQESAQRGSARTPPNSRPIAPCRSRSVSWTESAPAHTPYATSTPSVTWGAWSRAPERHACARSAANGPAACAAWSSVTPESAGRPARRDAGAAPPPALRRAGRLSFSCSLGCSFSCSSTHSFGCSFSVRTDPAEARIAAAQTKFPENSPGRHTSPGPRPALWVGWVVVGGAGSVSGTGRSPALGLFSCDRLAAAAAVVVKAGGTAEQQVSDDVRTSVGRDVRCQ